MLSTFAKLTAKNQQNVYVWQSARA